MSSHVYLFHCHGNGDSQELDDRHSDRSRVESQLLQADDVFQSERSRVSFKLHIAKKRMPKSFVGTMTKMMFASWHNSVHHRFSGSSATWPMFLNDSS